MKDLATAGQTRESRLTRTSRDEDRAASIMFPKRRLIDIAAHRTGVAVDVLRLADEGLALGQVVSGGHEIALEDPDNIALLLPTQGRIEMQTGDGEHGFGSGSLILVQAAERRTRVIAPKGGVFRATTVQIPRNRLIALRTVDAGMVGPSADRAAQSLDTAFTRQFGHLLSQLGGAVFRQSDRLLAPRALAEFVSMIDDLLVEAIGQANAETRTYGGLREFQRVSQACDIMQAGAEEAMSMAGLAAVLGVTPRSLQLSFRALHGMSPRQYLERVRLDRVRARILSQGEAISVTTAALECGFTHLGRFSQVYRRTFGELPNETRARQWHLSDPDPINYPPNARNKRG